MYFGKEKSYTNLIMQLLTIIIVSSWVRLALFVTDSLSCLNPVDLLAPHGSLPCWVRIASPVADHFPTESGLHVWPITIITSLLSSCGFTCRRSLPVFLLSPDGFTCRRSQHVDNCMVPRQPITFLLNPGGSPCGIRMASVVADHFPAESG